MKKFLVLLTLGTVYTTTAHAWEAFYAGAWHDVDACYVPQNSNDGPYAATVGGNTVTNVSNCRETSGGGGYFDFIEQVNMDVELTCDLLDALCPTKYAFSCGVDGWTCEAESASTKTDSLSTASKSTSTKRSDTSSSR